MNLQKTKDGKKWIVRKSSRHPITGVPITRTRITKTKREAVKKYEEMVLEFNKLKEEVKVPTWGPFIQDFFKIIDSKDYAFKTKYNYKVGLKGATIPKWSSELVSHITSEQIRHLVEVDLGDRSPSHRKTIRKYIKGAFDYAVAQKYVLANPCPEIRFGIKKKVKKVLTESQVKEFLKTAYEMDMEWKDHWAMALYTGMRNGELYALTWDKVNIEDRKIVVDCSWDNKSGFKETKSGDERILEVARPLIPILQRLKTETSDQSAFVLPRIDKWDRGEQARELRMFLQGIGLPQIRFHDLRATWATLLLNNGVAPAKVMRMGGWQNMKTMMIYMEMTGVDIKGVTDSLDFGLFD